MKKFLCLLVALILVGSIALAEFIDLSSMTDDELMALQSTVADEIKKRKGDESTIGSWYDYGIGQYLPSFSEVTGNTPMPSDICWNDDTSFGDQFEGVTEEDFKAYCTALNEWGYNIDKFTTQSYYEASNSNGILVEVYLIDDLFTIKADQM
jgi:hypothetical protein